MWGTWIFFIIGGILAVALGIGMAFMFAAPFFAVPIALFAFLAGALVLRARRSTATTAPENARANADATRRQNRPDRPDAGEARPSH